MMRNRERNRTRRRARGEVIERRAGSLRPFKHAADLLSRMAQIVDKGLNPIDRQLELNMLPAYVSRGHGGRHRVMQPQAGSRTRLDRSKYDPRHPVYSPPARDTTIRDAHAYVDRIVARVKPTTV